MVPQIPSNVSQVATISLEQRFRIEIANWSASIGANAPSPGNGMSTRRTSGFAAGGCISIARSTAPATPLSSGSANTATWRRSQTNREAIVSSDAENRLLDRSRRELKPIRIRKSQYLNNRIDQDHRRIKRRIRSMLGFKSFSSAAVTLAGIEMVHMMRKWQ